MNQRVTNIIADAATLAKIKQLLPQESSNLDLSKVAFSDPRRVRIEKPVNGHENSSAEKPTQGSIDATLEERGARYGQFIDHAKIAQGLQDVMRESPNWSKLDVDMKQALSVIADKIARILNGDAGYTDSWHDIQGYSRLVETRLLALEKEKAV